MPPASGTGVMSPSYTCALCVSCFQLVNSECFKKESQNESLPRIENKRGSAAVIGSTQGPPPKRAPPQHHCLNHGLPGGWVGFSFSSLPSALLAPLPLDQREFLSPVLFSLEADVTRQLFYTSLQV